MFFLKIRTVVLLIFFLIRPRHTAGEGKSSHASPLVGSRAEYQPRAVTLPACRGVETPLEPWPRSVLMSAAQMLPQVPASDLKKKKERLL